MTFNSVYKPSLGRIKRVALLGIVFLSFYSLSIAQNKADFDHPRGLIQASDVASLRERVKIVPYDNTLQAILDQFNESYKEGKWKAGNEGWVYAISDLNLKSAQLYVLTGEAIWAERSKGFVEMILQDTIFFMNPIGRGLTKAAMLKSVMMAYDYCYEAWDEEFRKRFSKLTYEVIITLSSNMGRSANYDLASNWMGVRYGTVLYAALVWDDYESLGNDRNRIKPLEFDGMKRLLDFIGVNVHPEGWNVESMGYQGYGWSFVFPALIAWENNYQVDINGFDFYPKMIESQKAWAAASVPIQRLNAVGIKPDFSDDGTASSSRLAPYIIHLAPESIKPHFRWLNRLYNSKKKGKQLVDGGFESILFDSIEEPAVMPPNDWLSFVDYGQGIVVRRNQYKDENDIVFAFSATAHRRGHQGSDNLSFRLIGFDNIWAIGSGRTAWTGGQTSFFPNPPTISDRHKGELGNLAPVKFSNQSTKITGTGSCTGVIDHTRTIKVAYDSINGNPQATFLIKDDSQNGKIWRLNTPEFNSIELTDKGFIITAPNGHRLVGQVKKNKLKDYKITRGQ
ncbi:MAG: hypothetical protein AAFO07_27420, partial [Bacteroidota bacterium]